MKHKPVKPKKGKPTEAAAGRYAAEPGGSDPRVDLRRLLTGIKSDNVHDEVATGVAVGAEFPPRDS